MITVKRDGYVLTVTCQTQQELMSVYPQVLALATASHGTEPGFQIATYQRLDDLAALLLDHLPEREKPESLLGGI